jgi:hypothetical protein
MKSPLKRTSPQGFHVLSRGFIPANPEWLSSYEKSIEKLRVLRVSVVKNRLKGLLDLIVILQ